MTMTRLSTAILFGLAGAAASVAAQSPAPAPAAPAQTAPAPGAPATAAPAPAGRGRGGPPTPTRDPLTPGYVKATELPDGAVPPVNVNGNFILGPTHPASPDMTAKEGVPKGTVHEF